MLPGQSGGRWTHGSCAWAPEAASYGLPVDEQWQRGVAGCVDDHERAHCVMGVVRELREAGGGRAASCDGALHQPAGVHAMQVGGRVRTD